MPSFGLLHQAVSLLFAATLFISYASCLEGVNSTYTPQQRAEYKLITSDLEVTIDQPRRNKNIIEIKVENKNNRFITMSTFLTPLDVRENLVHVFDFPGRPANSTNYTGLVMPKHDSEWLLLYPKSVHRREISIRMLFGDGPGYGHEVRNTTMQLKGLWRGVWAGQKRQVLENHGIPIPEEEGKKKKKKKKCKKNMECELMVEDIPADMLEEFKSNALDVVV